VSYFNDYFFNMSNAITQLGGVFFVLTAVLGACVGSFLNVVIYRLPLMMEERARKELELERQREHGVQANNPVLGESVELNGSSSTAEPNKGAERELGLALPRSFCPQCHTAIAWYDNIPLISYALLRGRCRYCQHTIGLRYPAVELLAAISTLALGMHFGFGAQLLFAALLVYALIALFFIDLDTFLLPDVITLPLIWAGLLVNSVGLFTDLRSSVYGAMGGYLVLWVIFWSYKALTGKSGFGFGDFKLLSALGAWLGWQCLPWIVLISSFSGAVVGLVLIARHQIQTQSAIAFGPYLIVGGVVLLFFPQLNAWLF
jgi:leader peptidase (prepilin peptidase)/N-methyltransferase